MIDQNDKIIQELKNRPINENGYIHVARQNNYSDLIKDKTLQMKSNKQLLKFECYVEWLENEVLYLTYKTKWKDNQRAYAEERLLHILNEKEYLTQYLEEMQKEGKQ